MDGASAQTIDKVMRDGVPSIGYPDDILTRLSDWMTNTGYTQLSNATTPEVIAIATNLYGIKWDHTDVATDTIETNFLMPAWWAQDRGELWIDFLARKIDAGGDENADLMLQAQIYWFQGGSLSNPTQTTKTGTVPTLTAGDAALKSLTTPAKALMAGVAAGAANANLTGFAMYRIDVGARLRAELAAGSDRTIEPLCPVRLVIGPDEAVGAVDMDVEMLPPVIRFARHTSTFDRSLRG